MEYFNIYLCDNFGKIHAILLLLANDEKLVVKMNRLK